MMAFDEKVIAAGKSALKADLLSHLTCVYVYETCIRKYVHVCYNIGKRYMYCTRAMEQTSA